MSEHTFTCSDVPGTFTCPACDAYAHHLGAGVLCVHPPEAIAEHLELGCFEADGWTDPRVEEAHERQEEARA